jgi:hypothetical protein
MLRRLRVERSACRILAVNTARRNGRISDVTGMSCEDEAGSG